jgi:hypothetical protein
MRNFQSRDGDGIKVIRGIPLDRYKIALSSTLKNSD